MSIEINLWGYEKEFELALYNKKEFETDIGYNSHYKISKSKELRAFYVFNVFEQKRAEERDWVLEIQGYGICIKEKCDGTNESKTCYCKSD